MDIYFFDQRKRQRAKPTRKTLDDLKASRRERPQSAFATRFKLDVSSTRQGRGSDAEQLGDLLATPQVSPRDPGAAGNSTKASPRIPKVFEQLRSPRGNLGVRFPPIVNGQLSAPLAVGRGVVDEEEEDEEEEDPQRVAFQKAQFGAPNILAQLTRLLNGELIEVELPATLQRALSLGYGQLVYVGGEVDQHLHLRHREWQTEACKDMYLQRKQRLKEEAEEAERMMQEGAARSGHTSEISPRRRSSLKLNTSTINDSASVITIATEDGRRQRKRSLERSRDSVISMGTAADGSDLEQGALDDKSHGPPSLRYRRESAGPLHDVPLPVTTVSRAPNLHGGLLTRLEKLNKSRGRHSKLHSAHTPQSKSGGAESMTPFLGRPITIHFSMASPEAIEKGWIVSPKAEDKLERETLILWLREHMRQTKAKRMEEEASASSRGANKPLEVRSYGDSSRQEKARLAAMRRGQKKRVEQNGKAVVAAAATASRSDEDMPFFTRLPDGSCTAYYPSGRVAVCMYHCGPKNQLCYTYAYADDESCHMLAMFTPMGSCCYDNKGTIRVLTNETGGQLMSERGVSTRQWQWPDGECRLQPAASYQLSDHLSWHCVGLLTATLHFHCQNELTKFSVGTASAENRKTLSKEGIGNMKLSSTLNYTSHAAALASDGEEDRSSTMRRRSKPKRKVTRVASQLEEVHVASVFSHQSHLSSMKEDENDAPSDLLAIRKNIKSLVMHWMGHLRLASGMRPASASTGSYGGTPRHSASSLSLGSRSSLSNIGLTSRGSSSAMNYADTGSARSQRHGSASRSGALRCTPAAGSGISITYTGGTPTDPSQRHHSRRQTYPLIATGMLSGSRNAVEEYIADKQGVTERAQSPSGNTLPSSVTRSIAPPSLHSGRGRNVVCCPVSLRLQISQRLNFSPPCRCDQRHMPSVTDVEFERFLRLHSPTQQLLIVNISDTSESRTNLFDAMLEELHSHSTRARRIACQQVSSQPYRIVRYALSSATYGTQNTCPLLKERHNISAGDCLMYFFGRMVFAGHTFNGYGNSKRDFMKQVQKTLQDARQTDFIAMDFKLSSSQRTAERERRANTPAVRLQAPSPEDVQMQGRLSSLAVEAPSQTGSAVDQSMVMSDLALTQSGWEAAHFTLTKAQQ